MTKDRRVIGFSSAIGGETLDRPSWFSGGAIVPQIPGPLEDGSSAMTMSWGKWWTRQGLNL
ncbi:hypothetical protein [Brevundimonas sp.]|uniref:hypothetical protein n=1 Tax=Brevundimonas sp. TaxID=1871086 RepID=UPI00391B41F4